MTIPTFRNFHEAAEKLLAIVDAVLPGKTLFLSKITPEIFSIEKVLDNKTGVILEEGASMPLKDSY